VLSKRAADKQEQAVRKQADRDIALRKQMYEEDVARQQPYLGAGETGINQLTALYGPGGLYTKTPTMEDLLIDPGYGFRMSEGEKALARMQAARGRYLSGGAIKAGTEFGQNLASQEFMNSYNRLMDQRATVTNALMNLGQFGQNAAQMAGVAGRGYAGGAAQAYGDIGAAQANRARQVGNIYQTALGDALAGYSQYRSNQLQPVTIQSRKTAYSPVRSSAIPWRSPSYGYSEG
jgi:hypothetical protein